MYFNVINHFSVHKRGAQNSADMGTQEGKPLGGCCNTPTQHLLVLPSQKLNVWAKSVLGGGQEELLRLVAHTKMPSAWCVQIRRAKTAT